MHEERVVLPVRLHIPGDVVLEVPLNLRVVVRGEEPHAPCDADRVRVDDEGGMAAREEQDRVGRLRAHPGLGEEVHAYDVGRPSEVAGKISAPALDEMAAEGLEPGRLRAVQARDLHVPADRLDARGGERLRAQLPRSLQVRDRPLHVGPGGLLHEQGADDHLEARVRRPPVLRTVRLEETPVHGHGAIHLRPAWPPRPRGFPFLPRGL